MSHNSVFFPEDKRLVVNPRVNRGFGMMETSDLSCIDGVTPMSGRNCLGSKVNRRVKFSTYSHDDGKYAKYIARVSRIPKRYSLTYLQHFVLKSSKKSNLGAQFLVFTRIDVFHHALIVGFPIHNTLGTHH